MGQSASIHGIQEKCALRIGEAGGTEVRWKGVQMRSRVLTPLTAHATTLT